jgi:hypothetical protein
VDRVLSALQEFMTRPGNYSDSPYDCQYLAIDATRHGDRVAALVVSVLYGGSAIPVAWYILTANQKGP